MKPTRCRMCAGTLFEPNLLTLDKAPAGAQLFLKPGEPDCAVAIELHVVQCSSCGLVQLTSDPVPYYRSTITTAGLSPEMRTFRIAQFKSLVDEFSLSGRLVAEIGAAKGLLTDLLVEAGADAFGIEGGLPAESGRTPNGHLLYRGYPDSLKPMPQSPYEGFVCINFLEHSPNPADFLRTIAASLETGAAGIVEVPSLEHMLEANLGYDWVADHLSYFSLDTLRTTLQVSGFEVVRVERVWHEYDWAATVVRRERIKLDQLTLTLEDSVRNLKAFVSSRVAQGRRVAIWGASHQALTLLTRCSFGPREIPFIIDSAAFKQGTLAPGCKLPVVAPIALMESDVDCVLIMAGGYSEEVGRDLRSHLGFSGEVAIYRGAVAPQPVDAPKEQS